MDSFSNGIVALDGLRSRDPVCDLDRSVDVRLRPHEAAQLDHTLEGCVCSLVVAARTKGPRSPHRFPEPRIRQGTSCHEHGLLLWQGKCRHERPRIALSRGSHPSLSAQSDGCYEDDSHSGVSRRTRKQSNRQYWIGDYDKVGGVTLSPKTSRAAAAWDSSFGSAMSTVFPRRIASS
jgi:hypothetical protein